MSSLQASGHGGGRVTASIHDVLAVVVLGVVEQSLDTGLDEAPGTGIQRLLLTPDDGLGVRVLVEVLLQLLPGEGVQLLNTGNGNVVNLVVQTVLVESSVNLARAENNTLNLLRLLEVAGLVLSVLDNPLELSLRTGEILDARSCNRVTKERLREEDDES